MSSTLKKSALAVALCATSALAVAGTASAAGFYVQESSISALGSAFSGSVTTLNDATTVFFNPAGMTALDGAQVTAGAHVIAPNFDIKNNGTTFVDPTVSTDVNSGNPYDAAAVPNIFAAAPISDKTWAGFGVSAPFGLANDYGDDWFGRYDSTETELLTLNFATVLAYKVNEKLSIGGGIDIQYAEADLRSAVALPTGATPSFIDAESKLEGDDISFGYNLGLSYEPVEGTEIGISYRSAVSHKIDGRISLSGGGAADFNVSGHADLNLPDILTVGLAQDVTDKLTLTAQVTRFGWDRFEEIAAVRDDNVPVQPVEQNYKNSFAYAIGGEYDYNEKLTLRAGYQFDETPTQDGFRTSRTPDGDRNWFALGATYKLNDKISLDLAGTYIDVSEEEIDVQRNNLGTGSLSNVKAKVGGDIAIVSFGVNYKF